MKCAPIDSCATDNGGCGANATCTSTGPAMNTCACNAGYASDGVACTPIDSCATDNGGCGANATCTSTGPATNTCACDAGYSSDGADAAKCAPINSCAVDKGGCGANATCASTGPGTNTCACDAGYSGDGVKCTPIDSCATDNGGCGANATCTSTGPATNTCACNAGYASDGVACAPIDNCATNNGGCINGTCTTTGPGASTCTCAAGYAGVTCASCASGYQDNNQDGSCTPSCATAALSCGSGVCSDASGTAICACPPGVSGADCSASSFTLRRVALYGSALELVRDTMGFESSGTFTVPAGVTSLTVYVLGGGGGGTGDFSTPGGGGGAAQRTYSVNPGDVIAFTVGSGGLGAVRGNPGSSTDGGDSFVTINGVTVTGGGGTKSGSGGAGSGGTVNVKGGDAGGQAGNTSGVCGGGAGAQPIDDGLDHYRLGKPGGCYPAGEGGFGPPQWGDVVIPGAYWDNPGGYVSQPGGPGGKYGGGGGAGGNYSGAGGDGGGGYVLFSWTSNAPVRPTGVLGVAVTSGAQIDTTGWTGVASAGVSETTNGGALYYALSFDGRSSFSVNTAGAWRRIVKSSVMNTQYLNDTPLFQYNSSSTGAGEAWVSCAVNALEGCLQQAFGVVANQMTGAQLGAMTASDWAAPGGFVAGSLNYAIGMSTADSSSSPVFSALNVSAAP